METTDRLHEMHRAAREDSQRTKFLTRRRDPRRVLAEHVVQAVEAHLAHAGLTCVRQGHNDPFDLFVQGARVEVKAARYTARATGHGRGRYQCNLRGNDADVLVLACIAQDARHPRGWFIIPFAEVRGLTVIQITSANPAEYTGRWAKWLGAWDVLAELATGTPMAQGELHG